VGFTKPIRLQSDIMPETRGSLSKRQLKQQLASIGSNGALAGNRKRARPLTPLVDAHTVRTCVRFEVKNVHRFVAEAPNPGACKKPGGDVAVFFPSSSLINKEEEKKKRNGRKSRQFLTETAEKPMRRLSPP
jgi:hypothetical protein